MLPRHQARSRAFIALGSNIADKVGHLRLAAEKIGQLPETEIVARSTIWRTPPWGKLDQDWFANAVLGVDTALAPLALLDACLGIEAAMGRVRNERWGPRTIDLDLLIHGETAMKTERLTLPHPAIAQRAFVLMPLGEIAPDIRIGGQTSARLLAKLDTAGIEKMATL